MLEPSGIVEIKFRDRQLVELMQRIDPELRRLKAEGAPESALRAREQLLKPVYHQVALEYAAYHDTPARMVAKQVVQGVVPWPAARRFFVYRLRRRLAMDRVVTSLGANTTEDCRRVSGLVEEAFLRGSGSLAPSGPAPEWQVSVHRPDGTVANPRILDDAVFLTWLEGPEGKAALSQLASDRRRERILALVSELEKAGELEDLLQAAKQMAGEKNS